MDESPSERRFESQGECESDRVDDAFIRPVSPMRCSSSAEAVVESRSEMPRRVPRAASVRRNQDLTAPLERFERVNALILAGSRARRVVFPAWRFFADLVAPCLVRETPARSRGSVFKK